MLKTALGLQEEWSNIKRGASDEGSSFSILLVVIACPPPPLISRANLTPGLGLTSLSGHSSSRQTDKSRWNHNMSMERGGISLSSLDHTSSQRIAFHFL
jgi:hypothetical protein